MLDRVAIFVAFPMMITMTEGNSMATSSLDLLAANLLNPNADCQYMKVVISAWHNSLHQPHMTERFVLFTQILDMPLKANCSATTTGPGFGQSSMNSTVFLRTDGVYCHGHGHHGKHSLPFYCFEKQWQNVTPSKAEVAKRVSMRPAEIMDVFRRVTSEDGTRSVAVRVYFNKSNTIRNAYVVC